MFAITWRGDHFQPLLTCAHCGRDICKVSDGLALWSEDRGIVLLVHQTCEAGTVEAQGARWYGVDLDVYLVQLAQGLRLDLEASRERTRAFEAFVGRSAGFVTK